MKAMLKTILWSAASVLMSVAVARADPLYINAVDIDVVPGQLENCICSPRHGEDVSGSFG